MDDHVPISDASLGRTAAWYALFAVFFNLGYSGLMNPATEFLLKDRFGLGPEGMARYGVVAGLAGYGGFLWGHARDRWGPRLGGDRGVMMLGHGLLALAFGALAIAGPSVGRLIALASILSVVSSFTVAGLNGGLVSFGKRRAVADRLSGFLMVVGTATAALVSLCGGLAAAHLPYRAILGLMAAVNVVAALWVTTAPRGAFASAEPMAERDARRSGSLVQDFVRLARSRAFLVALGLGTSRGLTLVTGTVTFFEFTNRLKAGPEMLGGSGALGGLVTAGVGLLYLRFARRTTLKRALALGLLLSASGPPLVLLVQRPADLLLLAILGGLAAALTNAPMGELMIRAMPSESAGLGYALNGTLGGLTGQVMGLAGAWVYARHGLVTCVALSVPLSLVGLLLVGLVPKDMAGRPPQSVGSAS